MSRFSKPPSAKASRIIGMIRGSMGGIDGSGDRHLSESKHAKGRKSPIAKKKNKKKR